MLENYYFPFRMELAGLSQITRSPETKLTDNGKKKFRTIHSQPLRNDG